ncbi:MAG: hypothetical protein KKE17_03195 [Proteobacteria bacterium]|nr:hypothetical protein [Pseudomonadota bacterium]
MNTLRKKCLRPLFAVKLNIMPMAILSLLLLAATFFSSAASAGTCVDGKCHENLTKYKHLHGPTAAEQAGVKACVVCHEPAGANCTVSAAGVFTQKKEGMCEICHEKGTGTQHTFESPNCLECHDPHGSNESLNFLRPGKNLSKP